MKIALILMALTALGLFFVAPSPGRRRANAWRKTAFAHRGLHGAGASENSLEAFEAACRAGFGVELDVQLSRDGVAVVFHDDTLFRMTGDARRVDEVEWAELARLRLKDGGRIPTLDEALRCIAGRAALLVELKNGRCNARLCAIVRDRLRSYSGAYLIESFHPLILRWFRKNAPEMLRGQLVGARAAYLASQGPLGAFLLSTLSLNFLAQPDFVAYDVSARHFTAPRVQRALFHTPLAAWTVRDPDTYADCLSRGEMPIFEGFVPDSPNLAMQKDG